MIVTVKTPVFTKKLHFKAPEGHFSGFVHNHSEKKPPPHLPMYRKAGILSSDALVKTHPSYQVNYLGGA